MGWKRLAAGIYEGDPSYTDDDSDITGLIKLSNIPLLTRHTHRFFTFKSYVGVKDALEAAIHFGQSTKLPFLTFLGLPGTGKTHLALSIGWAYLEAGKLILYYHVANFLNALRDGYKRSGENDFFHIMSFARNCSLLILDDLGAEKETEWATEQLDYIIDSRYENRKSLVVTTNLALDLLPPRIGDRLAEGTLIQLKGPSFRGRRNATNR